MYEHKDIYFIFFITFLLWNRYIHMYVYKYMYIRMYIHVYEMLHVSEVATTEI